MKEQFIPYQQAVEFKELGFDEKCFGFYSGKLENLLRLYEYVLENFHFEKGNTPAPLWQQAFDWFRVTHGLFSYIGGFLNSDDTFYYKIFGINAYITINVEPASYEETRLECLKKLIEIVKEQK